VGTLAVGAPSDQESSLLLLEKTSGVDATRVITGWAGPLHCKVEVDRNQCTVVEPEERELGSAGE
jgi:hypothetical protein